MEELAVSLALEASARKGVRVRLPLRPPSYDVLQRRVCGATVPEMWDASERERAETGFCRRDNSLQKVPESAVYVEASEDGSVLQR